MRNLRFLVSFKAVVQIDESLGRDGVRIEWALGGAQPIQYSTCSDARPYAGSHTIFRNS